MRPAAAISAALLAALALVACGSDVMPPDPVPTQPVYYGEVQRILNDNCVECHSTNPDRLAPFALATYADARAAAADTPIAFSVMNRIMPPYYAKQDGSCHEFSNATWMSDADIATLVAWVNGDKLEGDPAASVSPPPPRPGLARVDRTLSLPSYAPDTSVPDDYRCFVVDGLAATQFVTGAHIRPGNASVVHHVIVFTLDSAAAERDVVERTRVEGGPYRCDGGPTDLGATFLTGWAPGNGATTFPAGTGIEVAGGRKLVVQVHYNLAKPDGNPDQTAVDLMLADSVASRAGIVAVRGEVDLPPREVDAIATGTARLPAVVAQGRLWGTMVHMHNRGTGAQVQSATNANACLLDLDGWSFHWQHFYWYEQPITVRGGDVLRITCHYDTTGDTHNVVWGEGTEDEMCISYLYVSQ